ncbi:MAG TPA: PEPxxWA-CTERM sorting domain-containing protein [Phenylobacterium sp.]|jgi:hypothetical protein
MTRGLKGLLVAAAAGAALTAMATPASATAIFLDQGAIYHPTTMTISGPGYGSEYVYAGPVLFTANYGASANAGTFQFLGFCVDVFDDISVGINSNQTLNLAYNDGALVNNGQHSPYPSADLVTFNQTQLDNVSRLVSYGTALWNADALTDPSHNLSGALTDQLGAVQGAIWQLENPTFTVNGSGSVNALMAQYTSQGFLDTLPTGQTDTIFRAGSQSFAFAVPEPSTWAMMIMGFGAMGAVLRRRRRVLALA